MFSQTATAVREMTIHNHSNFPSTFEPWYHECKTLLMWLIADRDDDVHGHVDEPSVGVLLSWLINDDNNDDDHVDNDDGHGHNMAMMMYMVVASGGDDDNADDDDDA